MARGRMLNRKVATSAKVGQLGDALGVEAMLIHHRLIAFLDVNGVCRADPFWLKAEIVPKVSGINPEFCRKVVVEMERIGLARLFEADGLEYLHMPGFRDEQVGLRPDKESPEHPFPQPVTRPGKNPEEIRKVSGKKSGEVEVEVEVEVELPTTTTTPPLVPPSDFEPKPELPVRDANGARQGDVDQEQDPEPLPKRKRATRLPAGWEPNDTHRRIATEQGADIEREATQFRDHATATGRVLLDWDAGFRNWLRNAKPSSRSPPKKPLDEQEYTPTTEFRGFVG